ncbi:ProQ/FinO family protein [Xanthomonas citri pv. viticola]|nr:ProQ/FinO family protein [Xanthomonas citri pv. viticola]
MQEKVTPARLRSALRSHCRPASRYRLRTTGSARHDLHGKLQPQR